MQPVDNAIAVPGASWPEGVTMSVKYLIVIEQTAIG